MTVDVLEDHRITSTFQLIASGLHAAGEHENPNGATYQRIHLATTRLADLEVDGADPDITLQLVRRHLSVASHRASTDEVRVPVRNALQLVDALLDEYTFTSTPGFADLEVGEAERRDA